MARHWAGGEEAGPAGLLRQRHRRAELGPYDSVQKPGCASKTFMPLLSNGSQKGGEAGVGR